MADFGWSYPPGCSGVPDDEDKEYNSFYVINDGYGDVGVGFKCNYCGFNNMFVNNYEEIACESCKRPNYFSEQEVNDYEDYWYS